MNIVRGLAVSLVVIPAVVLYPIWPSFLQLGIWYLSVGVLGLLVVYFGIAIVRLIPFVITMI
ncbi:unnamed protein product [Cunninghamella blakesleeana]